jgi:hypothetical protein
MIMIERRMHMIMIKDLCMFFFGGGGRMLVHLGTSDASWSSNLNSIQLISNFKNVVDTPTICFHALECPRS